MKDIKHVQTLEGVVKLKQRLNRWGNTFNSYFDHISRSTALCPSTQKLLPQTK